MMSSAMASLSITRGARYPGKSVRSRRPRYCRASNDCQQGLPKPVLKYGCILQDAPAQQGLRRQPRTQYTCITRRALRSTQTPSAKGVAVPLAAPSSASMAAGRPSAAAASSRRRSSLDARSALPWYAAASASVAPSRSACRLRRVLTQLTQGWVAGLTAHDKLTQGQVWCGPYARATLLRPWQRLSGSWRTL